MDFSKLWLQESQEGACLCLSPPGSGAARGRHRKSLQCWLPGLAWPSPAAVGHLRPDHGPYAKSAVHMDAPIHREHSEDQRKRRSEGENRQCSPSSDSTPAVVSSVGSQALVNAAQICHQLFSRSLVGGHTAGAPVRVGPKFGFLIFCLCCFS